MSWDSYIDNLIGYCRDAAGDVHCDKACIIGIDGGSKWTSDAHPKVRSHIIFECNVRTRRMQFSESVLYMMKKMNKV